jgi:hypothetical protein
MNQTLRFADGADEVHKHAALAGAELSPQRKRREA